MDSTPGADCSISSIVSEISDVDHKNLSDPPDLLVSSEGCRLANEIVLEGAGTRDVIEVSWPHHLTHHTQKDRPEWESFVKREADTCESVPSVQRVLACPRLTTIS